MQGLQCITIVSRLVDDEKPFAKTLCNILWHIGRLSLLHLKYDWSWCGSKCLCTVNVPVVIEDGSWRCLCRQSWINPEHAPFDKLKRTCWTRLGISRPHLHLHNVEPATDQIRWWKETINTRIFSTRLHEYLKYKKELLKMMYNCRQWDCINLMVCWLLPQSSRYSF